MKKLIILIAIILSFNSIAQTQNRFEQAFISADSSFAQYYFDSIKFHQVIKEMEADSFKITISIEQCLQLYFNGYINGAINYRSKGSFDFDGLLRGVKQNKRSIANCVEMLSGSR